MNRVRRAFRKIGYSITDRSAFRTRIVVILVAMTLVWGYLSVLALVAEVTQRFAQ